MNWAQELEVSAKVEAGAIKLWHGSQMHSLALGTVVRIKLEHNARWYAGKVVKFMEGASYPLVIDWYSDMGKRKYPIDCANIEDIITGEELNDATDTARRLNAK